MSGNDEPTCSLPQGSRDLKQLSLPPHSNAIDAAICVAPAL